MTYSLSSVQTKTSNRPVSNLLIGTAVAAGITLGAAGSFAAMGPIIHSRVQAATQGLTRVVKLAPTSDVLACSAPTPSAGAGGGGSVLGASVVSSSSTPSAAQPAVGMGAGGAENAGQGGNGNNVITKLIGGSTSNTQASMSYTGPNSTNEIKTINKTTTTVNNDNDIQVTNNNSQSASTGSAEVEDNTTGGAAVSGDATNTSKATFDVSVSN